MERSGLCRRNLSTPRVVGQEFCTDACRLQVWIGRVIESLTPEIAPFGIRTLLVEPAYFAPLRSLQNYRPTSRTRSTGLGGGCALHVLSTLDRFEAERRYRQNLR